VDVVIIKWQMAGAHGIEENSGALHISNFCIWKSLNHFWRGVSWGTAGGQQGWRALREGIAETKVNESNIVLPIKQRIFGFQIEMGDKASRVKITTKVEVAIKKVIRQSLEYEEARTRFTREISFLKQMNHPFIAELFEIIEDATGYYLVMELVDHGNVLDW
jgi:serine/threonine protein kinase